MKIPRTFGEYFRTLAMVTRRSTWGETADDQVRVIAEYWDTLSDVPLGALGEAAKRLAKVATKMPTAAEWRESAADHIKRKSGSRNSRSRDCEHCGGEGVLLRVKQQGVDFQLVKLCELEGGHSFDAEDVCVKCGATKSQLRTRAFKLLSQGKSGRAEAASLMNLDPEKLTSHNAMRMAREAASEPWPFPGPITYAVKCACRGGAP